MKGLRRSLLALAMLLLLAVLLWNWGRREASEKKPVAAGRANPEVPRHDTVVPKSEPERSPEAQSAAQVAEMPASEIEGFVIVTDVGLAFGEVIVPESHGYLHVDSAAEANVVEALLGRLIEPPALEDLPCSAAISFNEFLGGKGEPRSVPQSRLRLRVRPAVPAAADGTARLHVVEILEKEILGDNWLLAWRDMFGLENDLLFIRRKCEPGLEKRNRLLEVATKFTEALIRARAARAGDRVVRWRVRREAAACLQIANVLGKFGLRTAIPEAPDPWGLNEAALSAANPTEFRLALVERWGPEQLLLQLQYFLPTIAEDDGAVIGWQDQRVDVEKVCSMTMDEFAALKKDLLAWDEAYENQPGGAPSPDEHLRGIGIAAERASQGDCERLILEGGARIISVEPGSAADAAGLRAGDIVWRIRRVASDGSELEEPQRDTVESPGILDEYLYARGGPHVALEYFRDGRSFTAGLTVRR